MTATLMIHCGGEEVARRDLDRVQTPPATATWQPIPHAALLGEVEGALGRNGLRIAGERHALARDGDRYFGLLHVANGRERKDYGWVLGVRNSHDQTFPAGFVIGSRVFVCDNLAFSGEVVIARRHTRWIMRDLPRLVLDGVGQLTERWHSQEERYERYRDTELVDAAAHDLVVRALDAQAITTHQVRDVLMEWRSPRHAAFRGRTAWSLFNGFTAVLGGSPVWTVARRTQLLHAVFDAHCGLAGAAPTGPEEPVALAEAA